MSNNPVYAHVQTEMPQWANTTVNTLQSWKYCRPVQDIVVAEIAQAAEAADLVALSEF